MLVLEFAVVLGGLLYAGRRRVPRRGTEARGDSESGALAEQQPTPRDTRRDLAVSTVSLGLATSGALLGWRLLSYASLPGMLFVFIPTFGQAWRSVRRRRVDLEVLDAVRIAVCVVMGYTLVAALDALLHVVDRRLIQRAEKDFRTSLDDAFGKIGDTVWVFREGVELETPTTAVGPGTVVVLAAGDTAPADGVVFHGAGRVRRALASAPPRNTQRGDAMTAGTRVVSGRIHLLLEEAPSPIPDPGLQEIFERAAQGPTFIKRIGERNGERLAPWMLTLFALTIPWMGVNRAAAFLTVRCGGQLRDLGPHTARQALGYGVRHGILVRRLLALELTVLVNTVVIDARVLDSPLVRSQVTDSLHALRQRHWPTAVASRRGSLHVLADTEEEGRRLCEELDFDDYFVEPSSDGRANLFRNLQMGGRWICYVGTGQGNPEVMRAALVAVAHCPSGALRETEAAIVLTDEHLRGLPGLFALADAFTVRQAGNLSVPAGLDLLDISTTLFLHFGLIYSILMSHAGMLSGLIRGRFPMAEPAPELVPPETAAQPALPGPEIPPP